jgi:hypothetical protein
MAATEPDSMTRYRISQGGEPVAIVASLDLAQGLARGQPTGYYLVDELPVDPPVAAGRPAARQRPIGPSGGGEHGTLSGRKIAPRRRGARRSRPQV